LILINYALLLSVILLHLVDYVQADTVI